MLYLNILLTIQNPEKNTLKFYHTNKSKIDTVVNNIMTDEEFDDRKSWNDLQITHSIFLWPSSKTLP